MHSNHHIVAVLVALLCGGRGTVFDTYHISINQIRFLILTVEHSKEELLILVQEAIGIDFLISILWIPHIETHSVAFRHINGFVGINYFLIV